jgi:transketolase
MTYEELLTETALQDERFIVMTAENRALVRNIPAKLGNRFIDTGITEQTMVGAAAGLALRGRIPVVHALASFLSMRAFEFVRTDAGIPNLPVKLSSFIPGFLSDGNGPTHQALEDISLMRGIPNMTVFAPADEDDLVKMLPQIWECPSPSYVRINTRPTWHQHAPFQWGKAEVIAEGEDITILTYGLLFEQSLIAVEILESEGIRPTVVDARFVKPIDPTLADLAAGHSSVITVEDGVVSGGFGSAVLELLAQNAIERPVVRLGLPDHFIEHGAQAKLLERYGLDARGVAVAIRNSAKPRSVLPLLAVAR